jgi:hypothetical protein
VSPPFHVKQKIYFPIIGLVCALFILVVGLMLGQVLQLGLGGFLLLISILQFTVPVVVIEAHEIQLRNLFGMTLRRVPYRPEEVTFEGLQPYVGGARVRGMTAWVLDAVPLEAFKRHVEQRRG